MKTFDYNKDDLQPLYIKLSNRSPEGQRDVEKIVSDVLADVKNRGDEAVVEYSKKFDKVDLTPSTIEVTNQLENALESIDQNLLKIIERAAANIRKFHEKQKENSWITTSQAGIILGQKISPRTCWSLCTSRHSAPSINGTYECYPG